MPIFVSRFSPERSLIGSFFASGSRRNETPERTASRTQTSAASSGNSPQGADRVELTRAGRSQFTSQVSTEISSTRSAPVTVSERSTDAVPESPSASIGSLTLLDQLRLRRNGAIPIQDRSDVQPSEAVENPVDSPTPPASVGIGNRLGPLAERLRVLTEELAANRNEAPAPQPDSAVIDDLIAENESANAAAAEESLDNLIVALQVEGTALVGTEGPAAPEPAIDTQAIAEAITLQSETVVSRETQEQTLREGLQTIASGLRADAAIETRQNVAATARNAEAASQVRSRREIQLNQREIQSAQAGRRSAQQEVRKADQAIRQLQSRNSRIQTESSQPATGTSLDLLAQ